jgi:hypothetical protein
MKHKLNPVLDAQLSRHTRRRGGHRRNYSDGRITTSLTDGMMNDGGGEFAGASSARPYSSLSSGHMDMYDYGGQTGADHSQSYLMEVGSFNLVFILLYYFIFEHLIWCGKVNK